MRFRLWLLGATTALATALGAEHVFDFTTTEPGQLPVGFKTFVAGEGGPATWAIVTEDLPGELVPVSPQANSRNQRPVLAQLSKLKIDERFPATYFEGERFGDFTFSTKFKLVEGAGEQIAGVVFRLQDAKNFYVVRANALDGNVRFYKFVNGERSLPVGNNLAVTRGIWHELEVECSGNRMRVKLDGREAIPWLNDNSFSAGRLGFITKSDAVSYFADAKVTYRPLVTLAEKLVKATLQEQPRLLDLQIFGEGLQKTGLQVLAAKSAADVGKPATEVEKKVLAENQFYVGRTRSGFVVTAPVRDRNGEAMGVVKFSLKGFTGQTEANAVARTEVAMKDLQRQVGAALSLVED